MAIFTWLPSTLNIHSLILSIPLTSLNIISAFWWFGLSFNSLVRTASLTPPVAPNIIAEPLDKPNGISKDSSSNIVINNSTIKIYNQPVVREAISKSIETADKDPSVEGIRIENKKGNAVTIIKEDFKDLIYDDFSSENLPIEEKVIIDNNAMLQITKLSFEKGFKWGFIYNGFKISITVKDDELMRHIDGGARFAKGDYINVKLKDRKSVV